MRTASIHRVRIIGCTAGLALGLAACGSAATSGGTGPSKSSVGAAKVQSAIAKYEGMSPANRETALVADAKKEGSITVYGTSSTSDDIAKAFTKKYGIKVNLYNGGTEAVYSKITTEAKAGHDTADVYEGADQDVAQVETTGLLAKYTGPDLQAVPATARTPYRVGVRTIAFVAAYNTDKVHTSDLPQQISDFADPKWAGKLSMEIGDFDWFYGVYQYYKGKGMTDAQVTTMLSKIAGNASQIKGHTTQGQLLAAGKFGVAISSHTDTTDRLIAQHAPVAWGGSGKPTVQPVVLRYTDDSVLAKAPHPAAALLWVDFNLSKDGAAADKASDAIPSFPTADNPLDGLTTTTIDATTLSRDNAKWSKLYDQVLRNSKK